MKFLVVLFFVSTALLLLNNCDSTEPVDELKPGRRDYIWTIDTLNYPNASLNRMWGSSTIDVWATSPGDWNKSISHFNGYVWSSYGVNGMNTPLCIFGFTQNDIYLGTAGGVIWKFNGSNWQQFAALSKDGHTDIAFNNIWGESSNDFYVFGAYPDSIIGAFNSSVIAHFLNNKWTMLNTSAIQGLVGHLYKNKNDEVVYVQVIKIGGAIHPDSTIIYKYESGSYIQLYRSVWTKGLQSDISLINNEIYFVLGNRIAKRVNDQFQTFLQIDNSNFYQRIWGRNSKDIFLFMTDGLAHYNGTDLEYLFPITKSPTQIFGAVIFEKDVFFLVYESPTNLNLVYHGKLN